ncbi:hypothetical protein HK099_003847 [Clydaea vesicula]|uniref:Uncharacterized protein n=1 Tax=Clydaea vesicula TaxID=447962 RepID=A0AAD5U141_9FUNG|nr:hypothetical protein HK099_003847 [Clydaea vesicula]
MNGLLLGSKNYFNKIVQKKHYIFTGDNQTEGLGKLITKNIFNTFFDDLNNEVLLNFELPVKNNLNCMIWIESTKSLWFGGKVKNLEIQGKQFNLTSIGIWNQETNSLDQTVFNDLKSSSDEVDINDIQYSSSLKVVAVAGNFKFTFTNSADDVSCINICLYDIFQKKWFSIKDDFNSKGILNSVAFHNEMIIIGGKFEVNLHPISYINIAAINVNSLRFMHISDDFQTTLTVNEIAVNNKNLYFHGIGGIQNFAEEEHIFKFDLHTFELNELKLPKGSDIKLLYDSLNAAGRDLNPEFSLSLFGSFNMPYFGFENFSSVLYNEEKGFFPLVFNNNPIKLAFDKAAEKTARDQILQPGLPSWAMITIGLLGVVMFIAIIIIFKSLCITKVEDPALVKRHSTKRRERRRVESLTMDRNGDVASVHSIESFVPLKLGDIETGHIEIEEGLFKNPDMKRVKSTGSHSKTSLESLSRPKATDTNKLPSSIKSAANGTGGNGSLISKSSLDSMSRPKNQLKNATSKNAIEIEKSKPSLLKSADINNANNSDIYISRVNLVTKKNITEQKDKILNKEKSKKVFEKSEFKNDSSEVAIPKRKLSFFRKKNVTVKMASPPRRKNSFTLIPPPKILTITEKGENIVNNKSSLKKRSIKRKPSIKNTTSSLDKVAKTNEKRNLVKKRSSLLKRRDSLIPAKQRLLEQTTEDSDDIKERTSSLVPSIYEPYKENVAATQNLKVNNSDQIRKLYNVKPMQKHPVTENQKASFVNNKNKLDTNFNNGSVSSLSSSEVKIFEETDSEGYSEITDLYNTDGEEIEDDEDFAVSDIQFQNIRSTFEKNNNNFINFVESNPQGNQSDTQEKLRLQLLTLNKFNKLQKKEEHSKSINKSAIKSPEVPLNPVSKEKAQKIKESFSKTDSREFLLFDDLNINNSIPSSKRNSNRRLTWNSDSNKIVEELIFNKLMEKENTLKKRNSKLNQSFVAESSEDEISEYEIKNNNFIKSKLDATPPQIYLNEFPQTDFSFDLATTEQSDISESNKYCSDDDEILSTKSKGVTKEDISSLSLFPITDLNFQRDLFEEYSKRDSLYSLMEPVLSFGRGNAASGVVDKVIPTKNKSKKKNSVLTSKDLKRFSFDSSFDEHIDF